MREVPFQCRYAYGRATDEVFLPGAGPGREIPIHIGVRILMRSLLVDGLLEEADDPQYLLTGYDLGGIKTAELYHFTEKGRAFIERWKDAEPLLDG
ncbi:hypothetical protein [Actinacidiphila glaucinigra]|uniref:hypothetical protein n=1 Tax=Actinacidiphila glaucinigra TaxID=235986 RepID=UPI0035D7FD88